MNRLGSLALTAASSSLAFTLGRHYKSGSELDQPADWFVHARDNLIQATVQQSIYRLGDPNVALSKPIIFRENYVISYDERTRNPRWVFEKITAEDLGGDADRKECDFKSDPEVHDNFRAKNMDFKGSGYDRGHLAAAANHSSSPNVMNETFLLSNISPQHPALNRKLWNKLECYTRSLVKHNDAVYVCSGPLFLPKEQGGKLYIRYQVLGQTQVAVPTHFFKILLIERGNDLEIKSFVMPNSDEADNQDDIKKFFCDLNAIERASGLIFFNHLFKDKFGKRITRVNDKKKSLMW